MVSFYLTLKGELENLKSDRFIFLENQCDFPDSDDLQIFFLIGN